jgi:hypothetical protein
MTSRALQGSGPYCTMTGRQRAAWTLAANRMPGSGEITTGLRKTVSANFAATDALIDIDWPFVHAKPWRYGQSGDRFSIAAISRGLNGGRGLTHDDCARIGVSSYRIVRRGG